MWILSKLYIHSQKILNLQFSMEKAFKVRNVQKNCYRRRWVPLLIEEVVGDYPESDETSPSDYMILRPQPINLFITSCVCDSVNPVFYSVFIFQLSHYLDIVEVQIAQQVAQKSEAFFHAMTSHDALMEQLTQTITVVKALR